MFINCHKNFFVLTAQLAKLDDYIYKEIKPQLQVTQDQMVRKREYLNLKKDVFEAQETLLRDRTEVISQISGLKGEWEQKYNDLEKKQSIARRSNRNYSEQQISPILKAR